MSEIRQREKDLEGFKDYLKSIDNKTIKELCNTNDVTSMRSLLKTLTGFYGEYIELLKIHQYCERDF